MYFKRKAYDQLLEWKNKYADKYAVLLEGARRVGKSTIAERFAKNEYRSYILIDFSKASDEEKACFDDINDINMFFLRLQALRRVDLYDHESVIIFDEVQLFPKARQAIKHLVKDGRYHYIETGSLISIKKNVKNILMNYRLIIFKMSVVSKSNVLMILISFYRKPRFIHMPKRIENTTRQPMVEKRLTYMVNFTSPAARRPLESAPDNG